MRARKSAQPNHASVGTVSTPPVTSPEKVRVRQGRKSRKERETMNEETMNETTEVKSAYCTLAAKVKKCPGKLPRIEYFRVDIDKGTGSAENWHATGYMLLVKVRGVDGMYCAGTVGAACGMNVKSRYKTAEEAREAGMKAKKEWGRHVEKKAKKPGKTIAEKVATMTPEERAAWIAELMAA